MMLIVGLALIAVGFGMLATSLLAERYRTRRELLEMGAMIDEMLKQNDAFIRKMKERRDGHLPP